MTKLVYLFHLNLTSSDLENVTGQRKSGYRFALPPGFSPEYLAILHVLRAMSVDFTIHCSV
jgi:hypothetical protein